MHVQQQYELLSRISCTCKQSSSRAQEESRGGVEEIVDARGWAGRIYARGALIFASSLKMSTPLLNYWSLFLFLLKNKDAKAFW
jgi:hypothetical protein